MTHQAKIEEAVNDGIRKTINRFRENPLYTFTECDLHSYLHADLLTRGSNLFYLKGDYNISLVHLEYPTNFRYEKSQLLEGYSTLNRVNYHDHDTYVTNKYGDRGNFDLSVLNPDFIIRVNENLMSLEVPGGAEKKSLPYHIINKNIAAALVRLHSENYNPKNNDSQPTPFESEVMYAIEFKYFHAFNARNINMIDQVIMDNEKLRLAHIHSNGFIKPINLVFCSSEALGGGEDSKKIINQLEKFIKNGDYNNRTNQTFSMPKGVLTIFIQSYYTGATKKTGKPIAFSPVPEQWMETLCNKIGIHIFNSSDQIEPIN